MTEFFQFGHHAGGDDGLGFGEEAVHESGLEVQLRAHGMGQEICVDDDLVRGDEAGVRLEEEVGGCLGDFADGALGGFFLFGDFAA